MKAATMASQIDILLSIVFQPNVPSKNAAECVDRLLSAFKQTGYEASHNAHAFGALIAGDGLFEN